MTWSVHGENGIFTRKGAGKHTATFTLIQNYQKMSQFRSRQLYETEGKMSK